ncbi:cytochrome c oxidase assembly protein [Candidatus Thioglobus sp.]|jgi:cytochrome c oxidase assembly protein subunit 11|uniref:cytochrome c oxidase assembly protein n=1 Tax=Candidatus Thioglobus sp. TaxID=2026721 RepID=UPI001DDAF63B|nr:cytochrome c oxidase assembly protein [Candidatus Thioglobus sp.]MBT3276478.1 cytochrome c oxidase assembly protein [Candidatus Thioglobus sp.]MBT3446820.1 cytochrome c oxidase assembly protein [Candidatus Thioglobus sp.]MBT3744475.1 cytochrome c oxidase assembly protein [Candidatus Thioglobus sp.]MBT4000539.1 cytochrome c oxidase assembly protein [Candidatus Thioglobus sp.]MBT4181659.1 cytochrome c oxidase assembly protein [Candidatus Thioglobus sp.]
MADDFRAKRRIKTSFWVKLVSTPILMFVFAMFVMPPIYDVFCEITGFNGTTGRVDSDQQYKVEKDRKIEVSFFAMTMGGFPVQFSPKVHSMEVIPGKFYTTSYLAKNNTDQVVIGQAVPSVAPTDAALHFKKLECFCFNRQVFKPHEELEMTLRFVVEPELDERIQDISLSYNFFKLDS